VHTPSFAILISVLDPSNRTLQQNAALGPAEHSTAKFSTGTGQVLPASPVLGVVAVQVGNDASQFVGPIMLNLLLKVRRYSGQSSTLLQYYSTTVLQYYSITVIQYHSTDRVTGCGPHHAQSPSRYAATVHESSPTVLLYESGTVVYHGTGVAIG